MNSERITSGADLDVLLKQLGAVSTTLQRAERAAMKRIRNVEKALLARGPRLEVWTPVLHQDQLKPAKAASAAKPIQRSVALGFAPIARLQKLDTWLEAAQLSALTRRWALVAREDCRSEAGKALSLRFVRLTRADLDVRIALSLQLDVLLRRIADEVRTRLEHIPTDLFAPNTASSAVPARPSVDPPGEPTSPASTPIAIEPVEPAVA